MCHPNGDECGVVDELLNLSVMSYMVGSGEEDTTLQIVYRL